MKITLLCIGKTDEKYLEEGILKYTKRLIHCIKLQLQVIPDIKNVKNLNESQQKEREGEAILKYVVATDTLILLDEGGKSFDSVQFSEMLERHMVGNTQHMIFVIGGPYGFSEAVYGRANSKISLSKMTFSHQMVRLFFVEQLYRGFSIMRGEPYHHR